MGVCDWNACWFNGSRKIGNKALWRNTALRIFIDVMAILAAGSIVGSPFMKASISNGHLTDRR